MSTSWKLAALVGLCACLYGAPAFAQPANDECGPGAIAVGEGISVGDNTGSVLDGPNDGDTNMADDVWFLYTASGAGTATIETCDAGGGGTLTDTVLIVYDAALGCPTAGSPFLASDDDGCTTPNFNSTLSIPVTAGGQYYIQVGEFNGGAFGTFDLNITLVAATPEICNDGLDNDADGLTDCADTADCGTDPICIEAGNCGDGIDNDLDGDTDCADTADCGAEPSCQPPANDNCVDAITLADGATTAFTTANATDEGALACRGSSDVWYEYTPASAGTLDVVLTNNVDLGGGFWDTNHSVYLNSVPGSCPVDGDNQVCSDPTSITGLPVLGGQSYLIRIGTWSSTSGEQGMGDVTVTLTPAAPEICDDGIDNDADGDTDCLDTDCVADIACLGPANDDCLDATAVAEGTHPFDTTNSTLDGPNDADGNMDNDVWFLYTATDSGTATIETCSGAAGTLTDTVIIVYDGGACPLPGDFGLANDDDTCAAGGSGSAFASEVTIPVCAGASYLIQVGGFNAAEGDANLTITNTPGAPANDDCVNALAVSEGITPFSNCGSTLDGPTDADTNMGNDVWFLYTASGDGVAVFNTCAGDAGSLTDTVMIIYDGAACPIAGDVGLASDDDTCAAGGVGSAFNSEVSLNVTTGSTYLIQIGGWANGGAPAEGTANLAIAFPELCDDGIDNDADGLVDCEDTADCATAANCIEAGNCGDGIDNDLDGLVDCADTPECDADAACAPITNDACVDALAVSEGTTVFNNIGSTLDGPTDADTNMGNDVWFLYTASVTGTATIDTCATPGGLTDTVMIVYDGAACPIAGDPTLASDDDTPGCGPDNFNSTVTLPVTAGSTYLVQVGGWANGGTPGEGGGVLTIDAVIPGDNCADAQVITEGDTLIDTNGATTDGTALDELICDMGTFGDEQIYNDVWYLWTASTTGDFIISTCMQVDFDTRLAVYDQDVCPDDPANVIACNDDCENVAPFSSELTVTATAGVTYLVRVGGFSPAEAGTGTLSIDAACVDPIPSFSAGPALSGIAPLTVDFMNTSDNGGDPLTTYDWDFGDGGMSSDENPSYTYTGCGTYDVTLTANGCGVSVPTTTAALITTFAMGDTNGDCAVDVADAVNLANYLFGGGAAPVCGNAADVNGDGVVDIADPVYLLIFLFGGGAAPVAPAGPAC